MVFQEYILELYFSNSFAIVKVDFGTLESFPFAVLFAAKCTHKVLGKGFDFAHFFLVDGILFILFVFTKDARA